MSLPHRNSKVILKELPEGAVLFSPETEVYFALNAMGVRVWRLLPPECTSVDEVVANIHNDYPDVNLETIANDVRNLLVDLAGNGLVEAQATR